jgi:hypothetical protein
MKVRPAPCSALPVPGWLPGIFMFLAGIFWLLLFGEIFRIPHLLTPADDLILGLVLVAGFVQFLRRWAPANAPDLGQFSLLTGGLAANTTFGLFVLSVSGSKFDACGQIGILLLVGSALTILGRTLRQNRNVPA